jgi:RNA polymerase sigma-70 factor (ECF subfamily)
VARRLALNARVRARRHDHDDLDEDATCTGPGPVSEAAHRELQAIVGSEVGQLPDKYRAPVVLCYLEGRTNVEAARLLGWPTGSMSRRLETARRLLLASLSARGFGLWLVLAGCAAALGWWNSAPTTSRVEPAPRLARYCLPEHGPLVLAVLESIARERDPGVTRAELAELANGIATDAASLPEPALGQAARELAEEAAKPEGTPMIPASRVLLLCANCHADSRR